MFSQNLNLGETTPQKVVRYEWTLLDDEFIQTILEIKVCAKFEEKWV